MSTQYKNPPVETAVCEFRFLPNDAWDLASPGLIYSKLADEFPTRLTGETRGVTLQFGPEGIRQVSEQSLPNLLPPELRFWRSDDNTGEIVVAPYRLAVHHRKPYPSLQKILPVIQRAFSEYVEATGVNVIQRIGLRYVNIFQFDATEGVKLEDYFDFYPFLGDRISQDILKVEIAVEYPHFDERDSLRLRLGASSSAKDKPLIVRLDLDYYLAMPTEVAIDEVTPWLEYAHDQIELAFEGSLKESIRSTFDRETQNESD